MIKAIRRRHDRAEGGFTLIELMVVVLIIAILIAIAIPTFLGARKRAQDRAAQSSLRNALTSAKTIFTDNEDYTAATDVALASAEPSLTFVVAATNSSGAKSVSVNPVSATEWVAAVLSSSGTCFYIRDRSTAGTTYASAAAGSPVSCKSTNAAGTGAVGTTW